MATCKKCGKEGAKCLFSGGRNLGYLCHFHASMIDSSVSDGEEAYPEHSGDMETRRLYHNLTSAPNYKWRGY